MLSFGQYLTENKNKIPQGVLIHGNHILVGVAHGSDLKIEDKEILNKIKSHGEKHGFYYEGTGGPTDIKLPLFGLKSKKDYAGGWDEDRMKKIKENGVEPHNLSPLFANVDVNWNQGVSAVANESGSIFDGIHSWANSKDGPFASHGISVSKDRVEGFLSAMGKGTGRNWLKDAKQTKATTEASKKFLKDAEKIAWPENWNTKKRTAGPELLVDKESEERNSHIVDNMGPGVYFAGSGHLNQVRDLLKARGEDFDFHGGEEIG
jgi:hypothetical protein